MLQHYVQAFSSLHTGLSTSRWTELTRNRSPHKALLLLAVLDLYAEERVTWSIVYPDMELAEHFALYWSRIMQPHERGSMATAFLQLASDGFWHPMPQPGQEEALEATKRIGSYAELREKVYGARLDEDLSTLLQDEIDRETLRMTLIDTCFATAVQPLLREQGEINVGAYYRSEELLRRVREGDVEDDEDELGDAPAMTRLLVHNQAFRRAVVTVYDHRCAFCGLRVFTDEGHTAIDAAHIIPWSISRNDSPTNGVGVCRLCHWAFDEGLLSIGRTYRILVSPQLLNEPNAPGHLAALKSRSMFLPAEAAFHPSEESAEYHRRKVYRHR